MDELVNAWVADRSRPSRSPCSGCSTPRRSCGPTGRSTYRGSGASSSRGPRRVPALGRRVVWTRSARDCRSGRRTRRSTPSGTSRPRPFPPGADLAGWAADRIVRPLPLDRPLWRAEVVDGLPGERFALIVVVHHVAADGLTGVALAGSLLDRPRTRRPGHAVAAAPPLPSHRDLVRDRLRGLARRCAAPGRSRRGAPPTPGPGAAGPRRVGRAAHAHVRDVAAAPGRPGAPAGRRPAAARRARRAGPRAGVTVNDLLLAAVSGGCGRCWPPAGTTSPAWCCARRCPPRPGPDTRPAG